MEVARATGKSNVHGLMEKTAGLGKVQQRMECEEMETANIHRAGFLLQRRRGNWVHGFAEGILILDANQCSMS